MFGVNGSTGRVHGTWSDDRISLVAEMAGMRERARHTICSLYRGIVGVCGLRCFKITLWKCQAAQG